MVHNLFLPNILFAVDTKVEKDLHQPGSVLFKNTMLVSDRRLDTLGKRD